MIAYRYEERNELQRLNDKLNKAVGRKNFIRDELKDTEQELETVNKKFVTASKARIVLQEVAKNTQSNLQLHISALTSMALDSVYENPPDFVVRFENRRNQTECDLLFSEGGKEQSPLDSGGYGLCDIASFALRPSFWAINPNSPVMLLDEPFRNLSPDLHERAGQMLKMVGEKLRLQYVVVSHSNTINEAADCTFIVTKNFKTGISSVEEV